MLLNKKLAVFISMLILSLAFMLSSCGNNKNAAHQESTNPQLKIGVIQLAQHPALDEARKGFVAGLKVQGYEEGKNITFEYHNAQDDPTNLNNIARRLVHDQVKLIYAIGTTSAQAAMHATQELPIIGGAITDYKAAGLVQGINKPSTNVTGCTDDIPATKQLELLLTLVPQTKRVGIIYCYNETNSQFQVKSFKEAALKKGLAIQEAPITIINDLQPTARSLVGKVDALYLPTDSMVASGILILTTVTDEAKLPIICGDTNMCKAGGVAALGIDYYKQGIQASAMAADILAGKAKPQDMPIQSSPSFQLVINTKAAKKIGLKVPEALLKDAEIVQ